MPPTQLQKQWILERLDGFESLTLKNAAIPRVGDNDVLVKLHAASLNYRDAMIAVDEYPFPKAPGYVPVSDGAGTIEAIGDRVTRFKVGDKVIPIFNQGHIGGSLDIKTIRTGLGGVSDGVMRQYGAFNEHGIVKMPENLNFFEAACLPVAAVTAWNALYGLETRAIKPGEWVVTQGSGGVSVFAIQFAKAVGAKVIATTSSAKKADKLKELGADHVINYKENPNWGEIAKSLIPEDQGGAAHILDVGGPATMEQCLKAVKIDGVITLIGILGGDIAVGPSFWEALRNLCTVRGLLVGSRLMFEEMNRAIEANNIHPIIDEKIFEFDQVKEAYQYMRDGKHFGKICIKID